MQRPLAFIDVETTGLNPATNRITEIGVVTLTGHTVERWTTLIRTTAPAQERIHSLRPRSAVDDTDAPRFADVAHELERRLSGRLLVAHNARFDYAFLKAEFERVKILFHPAIVCSVMLARKMYPLLSHYDLDSLADHHGLVVDIRHRALPDADLLYQFWTVLLREKSMREISRTVADLLAGPMFPPHLDPSLIDRLPGAPGAYVMYGEHNDPIFVGAADNLRLHLRDYFRIDQATASALQLSHRVTNITWRATCGPFGARLRAAIMGAALFAAPRNIANAAALSWQFNPQAVPSVSLVSINERVERQYETFGLFASERKARNALRRLASARRLCHAMLGIADGGEVSICLACPIDRGGSKCGRRVDRARQLTRILIALKPIRVPPWPYRGAVGIRERRDLHVFRDWRYLGTASNEAEVHALAQEAMGDFDKRIYQIVAQELTRLPRQRIVDLGALAVGDEQFACEAV
jgi:DNA polymerase III subunit epsilon